MKPRNGNWGAGRGGKNPKKMTRARSQKQAEKSRIVTQWIERKIETAKRLRELGIEPFKKSEPENIGQRQRQIAVERKRNELALKTLTALATGRKSIASMNAGEIQELKKAVQAMFRERRPGKKRPESAMEIVKALRLPASWEKAVEEIFRAR